MARKTQIIIAISILILAGAGFIYFQFLGPEETGRDTLITQDTPNTTIAKDDLVSICYPINEVDAPRVGRRYRVWTFSDTEYKSNQQGEINFFEFFKNSKIEDFEWDDAIHTGDLSASRQEGEFQAYLKDLEGAGYQIQDFHGVAGNHDGYCNQDGCFFGLYQKYINEKLNYTYDFGNIHFIFATTDSKEIESRLALETIYWIREEVKNNQDKIIVIVNHYPPRFNPEFLLIAEAYDVDLFLYGHTHCPLNRANYCASGQGFDPDYPFTCFLRYNTAFIDSGSVLNNDSRFLVFTEGSDILQIATLDHNKGVKDFAKAVKMSKKFKFE